MVIFFKKGNRKDIKNYRPICLLSNMYRLFTKIITTRLEKKLDENQPREQAGFRSKYSTTDHIHAINQLKEKCREYNILGLERIHQVTNTIRIVNTGWRIRICIREYTFSQRLNKVQSPPFITRPAITRYRV